MLEVDITGRAGPHTLRVELTAADGVCVALAGPSGAGKTTFLRMLAGLARPREGSIRLAGRTLFDAAGKIDVMPEQRRCGCVFQDYALFPHLPAWRNVAYALTGRRSTRRGAAIELLARLDAEDLADALPGELSGGQRQRVALARAVADDPELLLFDEPLGALDVRTRTLAAREIAETVAQLGVPAVLVTHDYVEAILLGHQLAVLEAGQIVQRGSAAELTAAPKTPFVADLTGANLLRGRARRRADGLTELALDGGGRVLSTDAAEGDAALSVQPWEIVLGAAADAPAAISMQNRLTAEVTSLTTIGNRVRVGLALPQPLIAEVTQAAVRDLNLARGSSVAASFKASAARLFAR